MPASPEVIQQLGLLKSKIVAWENAGGKNATLDELGLGSADFLMSQFYPKPTVSDTMTATSAEYLELTRYFESHLYPVLQLRDVTDFARYYGVLATAMLQAKASINGSILGSTLFVRSIRPTTVYANGNTGGAATETWDYSAAAGWVVPLYTINLNVVTSTLAANTANNVALVAMAVSDLAASPKLFEYQWYGPRNEQLNVDSAPEILIPGSSGLIPGRLSVYCDKNQTVKLDANFAAAGVSIPVIFGAEFVSSNISYAE